MSDSRAKDFSNGGNANVFQCPVCPIRLAMVQKSEEHWGCPRCHTVCTAQSIPAHAAQSIPAHAKENVSAESSATAMRLAQFGGAGGGGQFQPGSNPNGGSSNGGFKSPTGVNSFVIDEGLDAIMSRTHQNAPDDPERNIEKRLESMHVYGEEDSIPYDLTLQERKDLRIRKQVRQRQINKEQSDRSVDQNSPDFVRKHYFPKPEHMRTTEESLDLKNPKRNDREKDKREDESPEQAKAERTHWASQEGGRISIAHPPSRRRLTMRLAAPIISPTSTVFDDTNDDNEYGEGANQSDDPLVRYDHGQFNTAQEIGQSPNIMNQDDYNKNLGDMSKTQGGLTSKYNETTLMDYPNPDQMGDHSQTPAPPQPSMIVDKSDTGEASGKGLEGQMDSLRRPEITRLPFDPTYPMNFDEKLGNEGTNQRFPDVPDKNNVPMLGMPA